MTELHDLRSAINRVDHFGPNTRYASDTDRERVQRYAAKAIAALDRLALEVTIADYRRQEQDARDAVKRNRTYAVSLAKTRPKRPTRKSAQ